MTVRCRAPVNFASVGPTAGLELADVVCLLGRFPALSGLTMSVAAGEIVGVEGPNGAGKTTFIRACAGLQPITAGSATVCGIDVRRNPRAVRRSVGYLGHRSLLYDDLTVEDNVRFAVQANRGDAGAVRSALRSVGIDHRVAGLALHACSAGQRRRTALAAVVARNPDLWLLDEPYAGLDAESSEMLDSLLSSAADAGAAVVVVSHDHAHVQRFATRVVTIAGGHAVDPGPRASGSRS